MNISFVKKTSLAIILIASIASCKSEKTEKLLVEIDQLITEVDSSNIVFKSIDTASISTAKLYAESQLDYLKEFNTDTTYKKARFIDVYNSNFKLMRKLLSSYSRLGSEIEYSKNQLTHLSNDVKNGLAADSTYIKYFNGEKKAVETIKVTAKSFKDWETRSINRYNGMVLPIDTIITDLKKQGYR